MKMTTLKLAILGGQSVGKSALTVRYLTKRFIGEYRSDTDILYRQRVHLCEDSIDLEILDTTSSKTGQESSLEATIDWADGFVVVYDVNRQSTCNYALDLIQTLLKIRGQNCHAAILLIGNKNDLKVNASLKSQSSSQNILAVSLENRRFSQPLPIDTISITVNNEPSWTNQNAAHVTVSASEDPAKVESVFLSVIKQIYALNSGKKRPSSITRAFGSIFNKKKTMDISPNRKS